MNKTKLIEILGRTADVIEENKLYLTELDTEIGDGDHGINMARGFAAVKEKLSGYEEMSCGAIFIDVGKMFIKVVAGSSGPLYGSAFKVIGKTVGDSEEVTYIQFVEGFEKGIAKIQALGMAKEGEKTMIDAMLPALREMQKADIAADGIKNAVAAAEKAVEHTKEIIATKGRASYVGERSIGHQDPGATSFYIMLKVLSEAL
ncbi:MAG: dihydroxyacetone kinase subunit L [Clostridia bacterium]|nr:dihydroxyacetone kinase subunit L [Clostridia bacterium]